MYRNLLLASTALSCFLCASASFAVPPVYDLQVLPVRQGSAAYGINDSGDVVGSGFFANSPTQHPFLYDAESATVKNLNDFSGGRGIANDINESGMVTGFIDDGGLRPFIYDGVAFSTMDVSLLGYDGGFGSGINDQGQVAGTLRNDDGTSSAFFYDGQSIIELGTLGGSWASGEGINNLGVVVGGSQLNSSTTMHAFAFENHEMHDLGAFDPAFPDSYAWDVNAEGLAVGSVSQPAGGGLTWAAKFTDGTVQLLGALSNNPEAEWSYARGVNDAGAIVGQAHIVGFLPKGFIYLDQEMHDLNMYVRNPRGLSIVEANAINNAGQIAGRAQKSDGSVYAVLLTPVPEPTTLVLATITLLAAATQLKKAGQGGGEDSVQSSRQLN